jgi:hypothetical protein
MREGGGEEREEREREGEGERERMDHGGRKKKCIEYNTQRKGE